MYFNDGMAIADMEIVSLYSYFFTVGGEICIILLCTTISFPFPAESGVVASLSANGRRFVTLQQPANFGATDSPTLSIPG